MKRDPEIEAWVERAKRTDIWTALHRVAPSAAVKRRGHKGVGPCPVCGGKDRFSINGGSDQWFYCRKSDQGGDVIALVEYVTGANFLGACEILTGEAMPKRKPDDEVRREDPALIEQRRLDAEAEAQRREVERNSYRDKERGRARQIWVEGVAAFGTLAEDYLRLRGVQPPAGARLRFHPALPFWQTVDGKPTKIFTGPAMLARIDDNDNRFIGCHCTWIDLSQRKGRAVILDPETGEVLASKKVRGSQDGGHIHLGGSPAACDRLIMGEGIETTLTAREALMAGGRSVEQMMFWAAVNLGNIGGPSAGSVVHPTETSTDKKGRVRRSKVPGPLPDLESDRPALWPGPQIHSVILLGDGDSDRFATEQHLLRGAARWQTRGVSTSIAWPPQGQDFNGVWTRGQAA